MSEPTEAMSSAEVRQKLPDAPSASQPHVGAGVVYGVMHVGGDGAQLMHVRPSTSEQSLGDIGGGGDGGGGDGGGMQTTASILWHSPPAAWYICKLPTAFGTSEYQDSQLP